MSTQPQCIETQPTPQAEANPKGQADAEDQAWLDAQVKAKAEAERWQAEAKAKADLESKQALKRMAQPKKYDIMALTTNGEVHPPPQYAKASVAAFFDPTFKPRPPQQVQPKAKAKDAKTKKALREEREEQGRRTLSESFGQ
jgi:hypothetical protein